MLSLAIATFAFLVSSPPVEKPVGLYLSAPDRQAIAHKCVRGALIRVFWSEIEPAKGEFDFAPIRRRLDLVRDAGKGWSLGVVAGQHAPEWLDADNSIPTIDFLFRGTAPVRIAVAWDEKVQLRLKELAFALAKEFKADPKLKLVYVPQMTANGIEGHFNGCPASALTRGGWTEDKWVKAVTRTAVDFAEAFDNKALAVEVHEIMGSAKPAERILNALAMNRTVGNRIGAAMWWLSGRTSYQPDLLRVLAEFKGDKYAQVIARSSDTSQFPDGKYESLFSQAKQIGIRYIEPWESEFKSAANDQVFMDFQKWADQRFGQPSDAE